MMVMSKKMKRNSGIKTTTMVKIIHKETIPKLTKLGKSRPIKIETDLLIRQKPISGEALTTVKINNKETIPKLTELGKSKLTRIETALLTKQRKTSGKQRIQMIQIHLMSLQLKLKNKIIAA